MIRFYWLRVRSVQLSGGRFGNICQNPLTQNSIARFFNPQIYTQKSSSLDKEECSRNVLEDSFALQDLSAVGLKLRCAPESMEALLEHKLQSLPPRVSGSVGLGRTQESKFLTISQIMLMAVGLRVRPLGTRERGGMGAWRGKFLLGEGGRGKMERDRTLLQTGKKRSW